MTRCPRFMLAFSDGLPFAIGFPSGSGKAARVWVFGRWVWFPYRLGWWLVERADRRKAAAGKAP